MSVLKMNMTYGHIKGLWMSTARITLLFTLDEVEKRVWTYMKYLVEFTVTANKDLKNLINTQHHSY